MQSNGSTDTTKARENSSFIISKISDFHMIKRQSISIRAFPLHISTSFSVDEILLPMYVNQSSNFGGLPFNEKIT